MKHEKALDIGFKRRKEAAEAMRRWTGVEACEVCAVRPSGNGGRWEPVGKRSFKEIWRDEGLLHNGEYHLLVVDETGASKACARERFSLERVLQLAERLPLPVACAGECELSRQLDEQESRQNARSHALLPDA